MGTIRGGVRWFLRSGLRWVILALLIGAFLWFVPQLQGENLPQKVPAEERAALVNEYRRTWAQIIGGFGLLLGLYFTWRRVEIAQDQQVTERFTRAIDQLGATDDKTGNPRREVRLGGIYALERIARDSPKRDYSTVLEVLTAYVRENTRQAPRSSKGSSEVTSASNEASAEADEGAKQPTPPEPRPPTADIQAILDVLYRAQTRVPEEYRTRLALHEANLQGANLRGANLRDANLRDANLQRAKLRDANLQGAVLLGASLGGANLSRADLQGANLSQAELQGADLQYANLQANLSRADLSRADLQGANLSRADLPGTNLQRAKVTDEQLAATRSLKGATMPNGQKYEDWLKGRGEENSGSS
jgi:hypothetical protein